MVVLTAITTSKIPTGETSPDLDTDTYWLYNTLPSGYVSYGHAISLSYGRKKKSPDTRHRFSVYNVYPGGYTSSSSDGGTGLSYGKP